MCFLGGATVVYIVMSFKLKTHKKRLYTDKLTGIYNVNFLDDCFDQSLHFNTTFVLIDIDNFKDFNTSYGYDAADEVLRSFTLIIKEMQPSNKITARFKFGDEFLIILPGKTSEYALLFLNDLRAKLSNCPLTASGQNISVYFSAGITSFTEGDTQKTVFLKLMTALTNAKKEKNKFIISDK